MKKIIYIIAVLVGFSSCNKSILDKTPLDIITDAAVWEDPDLIDAYLTQTWAQTYILVNEAMGSDIYSSKSYFNISTLNEVSDEAKLNWGQFVSPAYRSGGLDINGGLMEWWENGYAVIRKLNEFIQRVPTAPVEDAFRRERTAEARFLRAYNYYSMARRYGSVPILTVAQTGNEPYEELFPKRNTEKEMYDFVIKEMTEIVGDLDQHKKTSDYGRPTRYAALALKCRAALYAGSIAQFGKVQKGGLLGIEASQKDHYYTEAYSAAQAIIKSGEFDLYDADTDRTTNFRNLFMKKNNSEVILAVINDGDFMNGGFGWGWDFQQCPVPNAVGAGNNNGPYLELIQTFEYTDGRSGKLDYDKLEQGLWTTSELWKNKDPRFFATIYTQNTSWKSKPLQMHVGILMPDGTVQTDNSYDGVLAKGENQMSGGTGFGIMKYLDESHDNSIGWGTSVTDWMLFRYGEILLNCAEAAFELNKADSSLWAMNEIRDRAGIKKLAASDLTRERIRNERRVELAFEGHRYWDVRRWRSAEKELTFNGTGLRYILDSKTMHSSTPKYKLEIIKEIDGANQHRFYEKHYYFPITLTRTGNNKNLEENPGYQ